MKRTTSPETQRWVEWLKLGPLPVPIPNPPARGRRCRSLFGQDLSRLDAMVLREAQAWCRTDAITDVEPGLRDWLRTTGWAALGLAILVLPPLALILARTAVLPPSLTDLAHDHGNTPCA